MLEALFTSKVRIKVLTLFLTHPEEHFYARELAQRTGEHYSAVWQELGNLERIGLLMSEQGANVKYYRVNSSFPIYSDLRRIILKTTGLGDALRQGLSRLGPIEAAFIYGSTASGEEDSLSDIDVMVVGNVDLTALSSVIAQLEETLEREINYVAITREELEARLAAGEPFVQNMLDGPKIMLIGHEDALRRTAEAAQA
jgi:predicted nucleotidyltransferase